MKIYFIIPVYNVENYLKRCVDSVLKQTYKEVRIILVDDGSSDLSPKMCDAYEAEYDNVSVIHKQNGGLSDARNAGLEFIKKEAKPGDFVTFLDSDDFVREDYAQRLIALCVENDCQAFSCEYEKGSADEFSACEQTYSVYTKKAEDMLLDQRMKSLSCCKIFQFSAFEGVRFPVGVWNEDEFTTYRLIYNCKRMGATDEKLYYYYQHPGSIMNQVAKNMKNNPHLYDWLDAYKKRIEFFEKEQKPEQVRRAHEKICADCILRYSEQKYLKKEERDEASTSGEYLKLYRKSFPVMMKRKGIALKRRLMYVIFYVCPPAAVVAGKLFGLRK